jgi:predicted GNAT superfamily acetyltransferase
MPPRVRAGAQRGRLRPRPHAPNRMLSLRDYRPDDDDAVLALNAASVAVLSPLDDLRLRALAAQAARFRIAERDGVPVAFLLALREGSAYASPNYRWFAARYARFLYVDRVVVAEAARGDGLGAALYDDLFAFARAAGLDTVACEFDVEPPNEPSRRFHARFGFEEVGRQRLAGGKQVSMQVAPAQLPGLTLAGQR